MKTLHTLALALTLFAGSAQAQSYGTIYPKYQGISTTGASSGISGNLWDNALGDSWNYPTWAYAYGTIKAGTGDSQRMVSVSNRNFVAAVTPYDQLGNFMNGKAYSSYKTQNIGYNGTSRSCGTYYQDLTFPNNTTVGYGIKTSKWSGYSYTNAGTSYLAFLYTNWGYQPGYNPSFNKGAYSASAWTRAGWLGPWSLYQPSLDMGKGYTRRWTIGEFTPPIDSKGYSVYRYVFTTAESLTASTSSNVFIILKTDKDKFLAGSSFSYYAKLFNTGNSQEVSLPAGRTYCIAVRDGVNTTSCEGAQVLVYGQYYR